MCIKTTQVSKHVHSHGKHRFYSTKNERGAWLRPESTYPSHGLLYKWPRTSAVRVVLGSVHWYVGKGGQDCVQRRPRSGNELRVWHISVTERRCLNVFNPKTSVARQSSCQPKDADTFPNVTDCVCVPSWKLGYRATCPSRIPYNSERKRKRERERGRQTDRQRQGDRQRQRQTCRERNDNVMGYDSCVAEVYQRMRTLLMLLRMLLGSEASIEIVQFVNWDKTIEIDQLFYTVPTTIWQVR